MTGQGSRAQRRRATRSTAITTATSTTIQTRPQSFPGRRLLGGILTPQPDGGYRRGTASPLRWPAGPCTHRPRPFACWTGCHLAASTVKGRCALMSARSAFGRP